MILAKWNFNFNLNKEKQEWLIGLNCPYLADRHLHELELHRVLWTKWCPSRCRFCSTVDETAACCCLRIPIFFMKNTDGTMISGNFGWLLHVQTASRPIPHPDAPASPEIETLQTTNSSPLSRTIRSVFLLLTAVARLTI